MICNKCGEQNVDGARFCRGCGAELPGGMGGEPMMYDMDYEERYPSRTQIPPEYKPISAWGYVGYQILFSIPLIGFILLLVFALGGTKNVNLRSYARSFFCALLVGVIIAIIIVVVAFVTGFDLTEFLNSLGI